MGQKSIAKAVFCLLARQKPVNLKTGAAIGVDVVSGRADRKNKHHIFLRVVLREFLDARSRLIAKEMEKAAGLRLFAKWSD